MKNPKVSVIIPAYNHEKYVGEAIQSVLDQTFQDFELIIINDGSTDNTESEILKFKDDRIRYYSQENRGLSSTLNRGIELARAEYFSFLPSDDLFYQDKLEIQLETFQTNQHDLGIIFSKQTVVDADGRELLGDPITVWFNVPYRTKEEIFSALFERNFLPAPTMMCRKECFDRVGGFDESLYYCQDYDMWLRILKFYDIRIIEKDLLKYRWHGENLTYNKTERADFERAVLLLRAIKNLEISDIFPGLKDLEKIKGPKEYSSSYRTLAHHILKSGLIELVPIAYSWMEEARKLEPGFEIEAEMERLISERPHFLDLRDSRLGKLTNEISELRFRVNRLNQRKADLEEKSKKIEEQEGTLERKVERIKRREEEFRKREDILKKKKETFEEERLRVSEQEKTIAQRILQIKERENYLERWQSELLISQEKWDRFAKKPYILTLRFFYKILKRAWKLLPEEVRGPIRARLGGSFSSQASKSLEIQMKLADRSQQERTSQPQSFLAQVASEGRSRISLGMMKQPKVSIVLPVYNQNYLIEGAIKSVLNQTYPNFELIIVNDGSTDRVNDILPRYGFHDKVKVLNQENQGLPRALSNGFRHATGSFLTWTSADNLMLPNQVETLVDFLMRHPDVDMVYSNVEIIDENGSPFLHSNYRVHNQYPPGSNQIYLPYEVETLGSIEDNFINASFLYRPDAGKALGEYDPCLLGTEDYDYWLRMNSLFTVKHLDSNEILYRYRVHSDSLSEKYGESDIFENAKILINYHRERESYYNGKFDVVFLGNRIQNRGERYSRFALEFRDQGHHVIWGMLNSKKAGGVVKREGMVEIFIGEGELGKIRENIFKHKQHNKTLIILGASFERAILEPLKGEDIFIYYDLDRNEPVNTTLLELVDVISSRSKSLLSKMEERFKEKSHFIRNGFHDERILRKARDNHYKLFGFPIDREKTVGYYGPLEKDLLDQEIISELTKGKRDWNFLFISESGRVDQELFSELSRFDNVYFLEEKHSDKNGNLYQILSNICAIWVPVKYDEKHEEHIQRLIEIASLSSRPLIVPDGLNFSDIPFVFPFKDATECAGLLDVLAQLKIDEEIFDRWIARNSWKEEANWFVAIANNKLFYKKTREPIKRDRKLFDHPPTIYRPNDSKVNVLIQARSLEKGGLEEVILNLIHHFDYKKVNILVLCEEKGGRIADQCRDLGIMVKILGKEKEKEYQEILKKYSVKVVNPHYATFGMKIAHEMGIPVVPVLHNTYVWFDDQEVAHFKACDQYVSKYIAVSENVSHYTIEKFNIPREKVQVIPNGLDVVKHQVMIEEGNTMARLNLGVSDNDFLFLNIASYDGRKGHHALLSALKKVKNEQTPVKVLCVGNIADTEYYARLKERIAKEGLGNDMLLHDYVEDVSSLYPLANGFILPSLIEGWSISVMEAMFYGLPLILTDVGGNGEIIRDIGNGLLISTSYGDILQLDYRNLGKYCSDENPKNGEALAEAMRDFYDRKEYWRERGARGKEAVQNRYNIDKVVKSYEEVFSQMLEER